MARTATTRRKIINTALAWAVGLLIFFPILWTILTSFKTEAQAIADPPVFLFFDWTLENYAVVQERFLERLQVVRGRLHEHEAVAMELRHLEFALQEGVADAHGLDECM